MNRRRAPLRTRPIPPTGAYQLTACSEETPVPVEYVEFISNPRNGFCSDDKHVIISCDFSNQEARVAAAVSKDPAMVEALTAPTVLTRPDGTTYNNVRADLHSLTSSLATHPHVVAGLTEDLWDAAVRVTQPGEKQPPRQYGKTLNFSMIYLSSAKSISERNHVPLATAEAWVKGHMETYSGYYDWAKECGSMAAARGFSILPYGYSSIRWVN